MRLTRDEEIDFALLPERLPPTADPEVLAATIEKPEGFLIVRGRSSVSK
jgi:hypothetical protein